MSGASEKGCHLVIIRSTTITDRPSLDPTTLTRMRTGRHLGRYFRRLAGGRFGRDVRSYRRTLTVCRRVNGSFERNHALNGLNVTCTGLRSCRETVRFRARCLTVTQRIRTMSRRVHTLNGLNSTCLNGTCGNLHGCRRTVSVCRRRVTIVRSLTSVASRRRTTLVRVCQGLTGVCSSGQSLPTVVRTSRTNLTVTRRANSLGSRTFFFLFLTRGRNFLNGCSPTVASTRETVRLSKILGSSTVGNATLFVLTSVCSDRNLCRSTISATGRTIRVTVRTRGF